MQSSILPLLPLLAVGIFSHVTADAQMVVNALEAKTQAQVARDEKGFKSCGVRAIVLINDGGKGKLYDFSVYAYPDVLGGMVKAGAYFPDKKTSVIRPAPVDFWVVEATEAQRLHPKKITPAETDGFILGMTDYGPALETIFAMAHGRRMQFAVRYKNEPLDRTVSFQSKLEPTDLEAFVACAKGLESRLEVAIEEARKSLKED